MRFYTNVKRIGNYIYVRGYENDVSFIDRVEYQPTLFIKTKEKTQYRTLQGDHLKPINPGTIRDTFKFIERYKDVDNFEIYGDISPVNQYIAENYPEEAIEFDINKIKIFVIDIETTSTYGFPNVEQVREEVLLITLQDFATKKTYTWGTRPFNKYVENNTYYECSNEIDLFEKFLQFWENNYPDIITGYNCEFFDIPYILRRIATVLSESDAKRLSIWKYIKERKVLVEKTNREEYVYDVAGITCLDFLALFKKFSGIKLENNRLETVAQEILGETKLDHSQYETFADFYTKDFTTFTLYNIKDCQLISDLEDNLGLIDLALTMAYDAKVNYVDVFYQVRMWDSIIYNYLKRRNICIPPNKTASKVSKYVGAYVKEPVPGIYGWILSMDLTSLYPSLIMQYNISPETILDEKYPGISVDGILKKEVVIKNIDGKCVCANGSMYDTTKKGIFPQLVEKIFKDRQRFKKQMLLEKSRLQEIENKLKDDKLLTEELKKSYQDCIKSIAKSSNNQMARKIQINSLYGAIGNEYFRYYKLENAEAITLSGQVAIRWIENKINMYFNKILKTQDIDYVIASDTDSVYINMNHLVETVYGGKEVIPQNIVSFLDKVCKEKLEKYINECYQELADYVNAYDQKMQMKRENIAERGIWTAKKRYILNVWDSEGVRYIEPKLKIMGIEAIKSSTPSPCRKMLKESLKILMSGNNEDIIKFIENCKKEFFKLTPEEVSFPKSVSNVNKYAEGKTSYKLGTPIHSRASLTYNRYIKENNLDMKYPLINDGEKIKFCYLRMPNPINENVIAFIQRFPKELGLEKFVDYNLQFEKTFISPLKSILDVIGWNTKRVNTLDKLFG